MIYGETTRERQANAENFRRMVNHESNRVYPWIDKKFIKRSFKKCKHINTQTAQKYSATVMKFADWCRDKFPSPRDPGIFDIQKFLEDMEDVYQPSTIRKSVCAALLKYGLILEDLGLKNVLSGYKAADICPRGLADRQKNEYKVAKSQEEKPKLKTEREKLLDEAKAIVCGDRDQQYGKPEDSFCVIAKLWSDYIMRYLDERDVAMMMILLKVARDVSGESKRDNLVDIAGYAACAAECKA